MDTPIIPGFFPDPSVCRGEDAYYTAHSSFEYAPGVPIFRSTDMVTWTQVGNALTRSEQLPFTAGEAHSGIYAPTIRYRNGRYWLVTTNIGQVQRGQLIVSAGDPAGPWSDPAYVPGTMGIDPDLCWDEDGQCRLTWASADPKGQGLVTARIDLERGELLEKPQPVWQGTGLAAPEGPHLYRIEGWWYQLIAEGGTERGHTVAIARARELSGPWETPPVNPILTHRSTDLPVQNVGHGDMLQSPSGDWFMVYHGVRPRGISPKFHVNGRETFIAGIDWEDGWPVIRQEAFDVPATDHSFVDKFDSDALDHRWISPGVAPSEIATVTNDGLQISKDQAIDGGSALVAARTRDEEWTFIARLATRGSTGRVLVRMDLSLWYGVTVTDHFLEATVAIGPAVSLVGRIPRSDTRDIEIRISALPAPPTPRGFRDQPDMIELAGTVGDEHHVFGRFDGRYLSTEVAGGFTGRVVGMEAVEGNVLIREVGYEARQNSGAVPGAGGARYDLAATPIEALLADPDARAIIDASLPELPSHPYLEYIKPLSFDMLVAGGGAIDRQAMQLLRSQLAALQAN
ncbi:family 43 glycosylhydrolase [Arthrobacter sp. NQ7]|uniref:glycoside hydrolase family 43 protein n=1 Tax=Arthrobacter sp. NQ7 TaxID=3032303 RepID=UPI0024107C54|nr:glycoside hydrolase family 43 protein [Arthrobacter sp. NQ7]MDJ0458657.1 family 43 glycosylhydrolase [Arthrobacter sp. NQ7]